MKKQVESTWMDKNEGGCAQSVRLRLQKLKEIKEKLSLKPSKTERRLRFFMKLLFHLSPFGQQLEPRGVGAQQQRFGKCAYLLC